MVGVKTRKTTGGGPFGKVTWDFGRNWRKTRMTNSESRMRFSGEAMDALVFQRCVSKGGNANFNPG